jgi:light-regulated signal transduction histidine kinase (bacteriophytochrome)
LQEPLRKIQAFGERLGERAEDRLDDETHDYLERMLSAASRMRAMINDLLALSRVTTQGRPFEQVDLNEVAREVLSDLETRIERTGGKVEVGDLPTLEADPLQMHQLLQNLIGNGLKFHKPDEPPVVRLFGQCLEASQEALIFIEDNGIGFEEQYVERIFQPFQRLHGMNQYEGSGMGLAICRKIVERHSGSIIARSAPGEGASFTIQLPVNQPRRKES